MPTNELLIETKNTLIQLADVINQVSYDEYVSPLPVLSNSTIGGHTRHIIELFQELFYGYDTGWVDYDMRKRNKRIETDIDYAVECIAEIITAVEKDNKPLLLSTVYNEKATGIPSNYFRELMYNIEHCIHHQAIIRIGLESLGKTDITADLGVAKSTIIYREQCVQ